MTSKMRRLFFNDGAGHVHAIEENWHCHEEGHQHGRVKGPHALALSGFAARGNLEFLKPGPGLDEEA